MVYVVVVVVDVSIPMNAGKAILMDMFEKPFCTKDFQYGARELGAHN